jgi:hypothetical protein
MPRFDFLWKIIFVVLATVLWGGDLGHMWGDEVDLQPNGNVDYSICEQGMLKLASTK